jgi:hypothetical protein
VLEQQALQPEGEGRQWLTRALWAILRGDFIDWYKVDFLGRYYPK